MYKTIANRANIQTIKIQFIYRIKNRIKEKYYRENPQKNSENQPQLIFMESSEITVTEPKEFYKERVKKWTKLGTPQESVKNAEMDYVWERIGSEMRCKPTILNNFEVEWEGF